MLKSTMSMLRALQFLSRYHTEDVIETIEFDGLEYELRYTLYLNEQPDGNFTVVDFNSFPDVPFYFGIMSECKPNLKLLTRNGKIFVMISFDGRNTVRSLSRQTAE